MVNQLKRLMGPYLRMARMMVGRCIINLVDDSLKIQEVQITVLADEVRDKVERFQEYGFTSHPFSSAEGVVVSVGGNRDHGIVIAVDDRRYRLKGLEQGEVAIYTDEGDSIQLRRNNNMEITCLNKLKATVTNECDITSPVTTINAAGNCTVNSPSILLGEGASLSILDERAITVYNNHAHPNGGVPSPQMAVGSQSTTITKAL